MSAATKSTSGRLNSVTETKPLAMIAGGRRKTMMEVFARIVVLRVEIGLSIASVLGIKRNPMTQPDQIPLPSKKEEWEPDDLEMLAVDAERAAERYKAALDKKVLEERK